MMFHKLLIPQLYHEAITASFGNWGINIGHVFAALRQKRPEINHIAVPMEFKILLVQQ